MKRAQLLTVSVLTWFGLAGAGIAGDVQTWLDRMQATLESAHHANLEGEVHVEQAGMAIAMKMSGNITYKDQTHSKVKIKMTMDAPGLAGGDGSEPMTMQMLAVQDGEFAWAETHISIMPQPTVIKSKAGKGAPGEDMMGVTNPMSQIEELQNYASFKILEENSRRVVVGGALDREAIRSMNLGPGTNLSNFESMDYRIEIDAVTAFPTSMTVTANGKKLIEFYYKNVRVLDPATVPDSAFRYTPPPGVEVQEQ